MVFMLYRVLYSTIDPIFKFKNRVQLSVYLLQEYLRVLNELISDFDELLDKPEFRQVVLFSER
jgi:hypothetical protein